MIQVNKTKSIFSPQLNLIFIELERKIMNSNNKGFHKLICYDNEKTVRVNMGNLCHTFKPKNLVKEKIRKMISKTETSL